MRRSKATHWGADRGCVLAEPTRSIFGANCASAAPGKAAAPVTVQRNDRRLIRTPCPFASVCRRAEKRPAPIPTLPDFAQEAHPVAAEHLLDARSGMARARHRGGDEF